MRTVAEIRRENLIALADEAITMDRVAELSGSSAVYLSQVRNRTKDAKTGRPRELGPRLARRLEEAFGKPRGWMDQDHGSDFVVADMLRRSPASVAVLRVELERWSDLTPEQRARYLAALDKLS